MSAGSDDTQRLRDAMERRRLELPGIPDWDEVAKSAGVAVATVRKLRAGGPVRPSSKAKVERALEWQRGSIDAILAGGEPRPLPDRSGPMDWTTIDVPEEDMHIVVGHWGELSEFSRRWIIRTFREAREELDRTNPEDDAPKSQRPDA